MKDQHQNLCGENRKTPEELEAIPADRGDSGDYVEFWNKYVLVYDFTPRLRLASIQPEDTRRCVSVERKEWVRVVESVSQLKPVNTIDKIARRMGELFGDEARKEEWKSLQMKLSLAELREGYDVADWSGIAPGMAIALDRKNSRFFIRVAEAIEAWKKDPIPQRRLDPQRDFLVRHWAPTSRRYAGPKGRSSLVQPAPDGVFLCIFTDRALDDLCANLDIGDSAFTEMRSALGLRKLSKVIKAVQVSRRTKEKVQWKEYLTPGERKKFRWVEAEQDVVYIFAGEFQIAERDRILKKLAAEKIEVRRRIIPPART